jgi:adenylate cyclase
MKHDAGGNRMTRIPFRLGVIALIILAVCLADGMGLLRRLQLKAHDGLFRAKSVFSEAPSAEESGIVIIEIDDATLASPDFRKPRVLWHLLFGETIRQVADASPAVIGLDVLMPPGLFDEIAPRYSNAWVDTFLYCRRKGVPLVTGFLETENRQYLPHPVYLHAAGLENIGLFNLTTDEDDFIRRQRLIFRTGKDTSLPAFSYLVARSARAVSPPPGDTLYIDYLTHPRPFPRHSLAAVYDRARKGDEAFFRETFRGKIVLIGETGHLGGDHHPTPLYHIHREGQRRTPGIEIAAHAIHTILSGRYLREPAKPASVLFLSLPALCCLLFSLYSRGRGTCIASVAILSVLTVVAAVYAFRHLTLLPVVPALLVILLTGGSEETFATFAVSREKKRLYRMLNLYLPDTAVARMMEQASPDIFAGEKKRLCILFSDIRNFTAYSEKKEPAQIVADLNEYFERMTGAIYRHDGIVDKYIGDGILAFFGAYESGRHPVEDAAKAALQMRESLADLNRLRGERGIEAFRIGIGLHYGDVVIGNIGASKKIQYTVIGDTVNVASRVEGLTKAFNQDILLTDAVRERLPGGWAIRPLGRSAVKGHSPVEIFHLEGVSTP